MCLVYSCFFRHVLFIQARAKGTRHDFILTWHSMQTAKQPPSQKEIRGLRVQLICLEETNYKNVNGLVIFYLDLLIISVH